MKRISLYIALIFIFIGICSFVWAQVRFEPGTEPEGFREIKCGAHISTLKGMRYVYSFDFCCPRYAAGNMPTAIKEVYVKDGDVLKMGEIEIDKVEYFFWKDRFCNVTILTKGYAKWKRLKEFLQDKFGQGWCRCTEEKEGNYSCSWDGETTYMNLDYFNYNDQTILKINSLTLEKQICNEVMKKWEIERLFNPKRFFRK